MKKTLLFLSLFGIVLGIYAQHNTIQKANFEYSEFIQDKDFENSIQQNKSPGDVYWLEDFSNGFPAGWSTEDAALAGEWVFIDADTSHTGAYIGSDLGYMPDASPGGYMHLPADFYNSIPGTWPREAIANPLNLDASFETYWIDLTGSELTGGLILSYATIFNLCCNPSETALDVSVTTNGSSWTTFDGRNINGNIVGVNQFPQSNPVYPEFYLSPEFLNGATQLKIHFRMYGASRFFWSIDDIMLFEPETNDISLTEVYANSQVFTSSTSSDGALNRTYSSVPGNIITDFRFGGLIHQQGVNAENLRIDFNVNDSEGANVWSSTSNVVENYNGTSPDTVLLSPENSNFYSYNPEIESDINFTFNYEVLSDNTDGNISDNALSMPFVQTVGRYSYHWQPTCGAESDDEIGPFSYALIETSPGDAFANVFDFYQEEGDAFKIYGLRVFLPNASNLNLTFDEAGNGVTLSPVLYYYDQTANDGSGAYVNFGIVGPPHTLTASDANSYLYLPFDINEVEAMDFVQGKYVIGVEVNDYNDQKIAFGVDETYRQGNSHFLMNLGSEDNWYYYSPNGSVMIDAYTNLQEFQNDQVDCDNILEANFIANQTVIQPGEVIAFTDLSSGEIYEWHWEFIRVEEDLVPDLIANQPNPIMFFSIPGVYTVRLIVSNASNIDTLIKTNYIYVINPFEAEVITNNSACGESNGSAEVIATEGSGDFSYLWSDGSTGSSNSNLEAGNHFVQITDQISGESLTKFFSISSSDIVLDITKTDLNCNEVTGGTASLSITGGVEPYEVNWSNCETGLEITDLQAGSYQVVVEDANGCITSQTVDILASEPIEATFDVTNSTCGNADGEITTTIFGGTAPYSMLWSNEELTENISGITAGHYQLEITDANNCVAYFVATVSDESNIEVIQEDVTAARCGELGSLQLVNVSETSSYLWSNGTTTEDLTDVNPGTYYLTVTEASCQVMFSFEVPFIQLLTQEICIVTVDTETGNDLIVWENLEPENVDYYKIYRENINSTGYDLIGNVLSQDLSEFSTDEYCLNDQAWRYKIEAVDACGIASELSPPHKAIHLNINYVSPTEVNLVWDDYLGFDYDDFTVYKYTPSLGWLPLITIPANQHSYTDANVDNVEEVEYRVSVSAPVACVSSSSSRSLTGTYSETSSNIELGADIITLVDFVQPGSDLNLYPNPNNGSFILEFSQNIKGRIQLTDISGKLIIEKTLENNNQWNNTENLESGIYIIKVSIENQSTEVVKMIVE